MEIVVLAVIVFFVYFISKLGEARERARIIQEFDERAHKGFLQTLVNGMRERISDIQNKLNSPEFDQSKRPQAWEALNEAKTKINILESAIQNCENPDELGISSQEATTAIRRALKLADIPLPGGADPRENLEDLRDAP